MSKIRVASVNYLCAMPFRVLNAEQAFTYEENSPPVNARKLHEREVDVALISSAEFARHGGYVGMDFGISSISHMDSLRLVSQCPVGEIKTIYLYDGASSSAVLLSLLFAERWRSSPRLVRIKSGNLIDFVKGFDAALIVDESLTDWDPKYFTQIDPVKEWRELSGKPFTFLVWATRPETLSLSQHKYVTSLFHRGIKIAKALVPQAAAELGIDEERCRNYFSKSLYYYLNEEMTSGLNEFYERSSRHNLLPEATYIGSTYSLLAPGQLCPQRQKPVRTILRDVLSGYRMGIQDGVRLATEGRLEDLVLVAEHLRRRISTHRTISHIAELELTTGTLSESDIAQIEQANQRGIKWLRLGIPTKLDSGKRPLLSEIERLLHFIKTKWSVHVEAFSVKDIFEWALELGMMPRDVVSRLITGGLDQLGSEGGELLINQANKDRVKPSHYVLAEDWINVVKWVHRFGAKSSCRLELSKDHTWEQRLLHLAKLRALQDENPGFKHLELITPVDPSKQLSGTDRAIATSLVRVFLDNIATIAESGFSMNDHDSSLGLCFGSNAAEVLYGANQNSFASYRTVRSLWNMGMDFEMSSSIVGPDYFTFQEH